MIRVCHVADHLDGEVDGVYSHILEIIQLTDKKKIEHFLCFQGNFKIDGEIKNLGGKIILLPHLSSKFPLLAIIKFIQLMRKEEIDIIHTHFFKSYVVAGISNIILRKKLIYNFHGLFIKNDYYNFFERAVYKFLHNLICWFKAVNEAIVPSKESANQLLKETKKFPRISQYYNGADVKTKSGEIDEKLLSKINSIKSYKLVYVGRIESEKRVDQAIELIGMLKRNGMKVHLFIFGKGKLEKKIIKLVNKLGLKENVSLLGVVPNPVDYFALFDCLILTSSREGMPIVIWQAMASGLPIISSSVGGVTEVLTVSKSGFTFASENLIEALEKIKLLSSNKLLKEEFGANGKKAIIEVFTLEKFKTFMENLYFNH